MKKNYFLLIIAIFFMCNAQNLRAQEPVKYKRIEMNGFTKWTQSEIDALIKEASHIGKSITEKSDGYKTNDFTLNTDFTVKDGTFTMTAKADFTGDNGMGFKNADREGKLAGTKLGAYPANFFCDLTQAEGIRFKINITNGTVKKLNIGLSNCDNNCIEYFVYDIPTEDVDNEGYITLPFERFAPEFWSNKVLPLNDIRVFIIEAIDATNGVSISFSDIHGYKIIDPNEPLTLEIEGKNEMCEGDNVTLKAISEATEYKWVIGETVVSTENNWVVPATYKAGQYTINVTGRRQNEDLSFSEATKTFNLNIYAADNITLTDTAFVDKEYNKYGFTVKPSEEGTLTLQDTLVNMHGCDSLVTLTLIVVKDHTGIADYEGGILSAYPNPSNGLVNIQLNAEAQNQSLYLYDLQGRLLLTEKVAGSTATINLTSFKSGIYLLKIDNQTVKVVKQ